MFSSSPYSPEYETLREWLTSKRVESGHTIRSLAEQLGISYSAIGKVEAGQRKLDIMEYLRFCRAVDANPEEGLRLLKKRHRL